MNANSFLYETETEDVYKDIAKDRDTRFDTTEYSMDARHDER